MDQKITELVSIMKTRHHTNSMSTQIGDMAEFLSLLADEHAKTAARMEQQTDRLIQQTDTLVKFTRRLHWFTVAMFGVGIVQIALAIIFAIKG